MRLARLQFIDATSDYDNALARFQLIIRAAPSPARSLKSCSTRQREVLIAHLGPMARLVVMNESREAKTPEDLFQRLLARIPSESEKAEYAEKLRSLPTG